MPKTHALLSASGANRWLTCTPSPRLEEQFKASGSSYADEGTLAHEIAELTLKLKLGRVTTQGYKRMIKLYHKNELFHESIVDYAEDFTAFVMESYGDLCKEFGEKKVVIELERMFDLSKYIPEGFGTGDVAIIAPGFAEIIDYKFGKGVEIEAEKNKQMMLYALGMFEEFDIAYNIQKIRMSIYQPRLDNYSSWTMTSKALVRWAENEVIPKAKLAWEGEGEFVPGEHCRFCRAKVACRAFYDYNMELAAMEFKEAETLTDNEIAEVLSKASLFKNWIGSIQAHALLQAVNHGKKWPGFKVVEGRSNRKYVDEEKIIKRLVTKGYKEVELCTRKLLGITAMERKLGKQQFSLLLNKFIVKPEGSPVLVPDSDKRPEKNTFESARIDFEFDDE